jgi:4'-phosphopantetheinyl transferase
VACAVTVGRDVGVDVEYVHRPLTHAVPERFFSVQEVRDLRALPQHDQPLVFFDYWTLKESYIKARGLGLALPLAQFTFHRVPGDAPVISFAPELHDDPASWQFAQFWPTSNHRMAVAVRRVGEDLPIDVAMVVPGIAP